jgi:PAS domain-containing protein
MLFFLRMFHDSLYSIYDPQNHVAIHTILEFFSILVSFSISLYGWKAFQHTKTIAFLWIPIVFSVVGIFDLFHTLSFEGMPHLITDGSVSKAAWFWISARITESLGVLCLLLFQDNLSSVRHRGKYIGWAALYVVSITVIIFLYEKKLPILIVEGLGPTVLKINLEYFVSLLQVISFVIVYRRFLKSKNAFEFNLSLAFSFLFIGEILLTLYTSVYDFYVFMGHVFKVFGYAFVLRGYYFSKIHLVFSQNLETERDLKATRNLAESFFLSTPDSIVILNTEGYILRVNPGFERIYGWQISEVSGKK